MKNLLLVSYYYPPLAGAGVFRPLRLSKYLPRHGWNVTVLGVTDRVRVLKRTIRNGETPPLMSQPDRVVIYLNPCAWLVENDDGTQGMESFKFGTPTWAHAGSHGGKTSNVVQQCSVIEVELKE